jgi:hypothetical protein
MLGGWTQIDDRQKIMTKAHITLFELKSNKLFSNTFFMFTFFIFNSIQHPIVKIVAKTVNL